MKINANRKRLAKQIAEILANQEIPADLYNAITDELTFYSDFLNLPRPARGRGESQRLPS